MGYKKQSKRKTPFKAYGRSQKNAVRFDKLRAADVSSNRLGQAVGAIGTSLGDAVQEFDDNYENKQAASTQEAQAGLEETNKAAADAFGGDPFAFKSAEAEGLKEIKPLPERPGAPPGQTKSYDQVGDDAFQKAINEGKSPEEAATIRTSTIADSKSYNQKQYGTDTPTAEGKTNNYINSQSNVSGQYVAGSVVPTEGSSAQASPENSTRFSGVGQFSGPFNRSPLRRMTPFLRSPFYATKGKKLGELAQSSLTNLSYLGDIGKAGAEGYNSQVDRHNYANAVREEQAAELDEEFGDLEVAPSGYKAYDASVEGLAREWKTEFVDAKKAWKNGKMSNEDWIDTKHRLQGNAASYGTASKNLQQSMKNWIDNKGQISNSTKPETIDFFNTMEKAPDSLTVQNIDGVPTFVGQTLGKKPISMPVDQIANGSAAMRFNTKIDLGKELAPTIKELQGLKTEISTDRGIGIGNQAWDTPAVQNKVNYALDKIVDNNAKLRSIASETLGLDYDQFEERVAAGDDMKAIVKQQLLEDIQESYFPVEKTTRTNTQLATDSQNLQNAKLGGKQTVSAVKQQQVNTYVGQLREVSAESIANLTGATTRLSSDGKYVEIINPKNNKPIRVPVGDVAQAQQIIAAQVYGVAPSAPSPTPRITPFKRLMNYITGKHAG